MRRILAAPHRPHLILIKPVRRLSPRRYRIQALAAGLGERPERAMEGNLRGAGGRALHERQGAAAVERLLADTPLQSDLALSSRQRPDAIG
jgi:hypothetical protein